ncbi:MAG: SDR family oxidoreductase [Burkholderiales bacterium]|nr:SDR family oxidoreductase [Burkholderiales bacterium]
MADRAATIDWTRPFAELAGRRVLVSGASRGIGAAVATAFAQCGAHVGVHYGQAREAADALVARLRARGGIAFAFGAPLQVPQSGRDLVHAAIDRLGGLDVLIANAGAPGPRAAFETLPEVMIDEVLRVNLVAVMEMIRAAIPALREARNPAIINTTSIAARSGGGRGIAAYAAAKAGVESLTRALAKELGAQGIRVNCIAPGYIETEIHDRFSTAADRDAYVAATPLGRGGRPDECVGAFLFLATSGLSGYVTGQTLSVNGGLVMP